MRHRAFQDEVQLLAQHSAWSKETMRALVNHSERNRRFTKMNLLMRCLSHPASAIGT